MLPVETTAEKPTPCSCAQSSIEVTSAPDCETSATCLPAASRGEARVQPEPRYEEPEAVGPEHAQALERAAASQTSRSSARPPSPVSRKPAEITTTRATPASPHERNDRRDGRRPGADDREVGRRRRVLTLA